MYNLNCGKRWWLYKPGREWYSYVTSIGRGGTRTQLNLAFTFTLHFVSRESFAGIISCIAHPSFQLRNPSSTHNQNPRHPPNITKPYLVGNHAMPSHYETLGLSPTATLTQIKAAYRVAALTWHPDKDRSHPAQEQALCEERFKKAAQTYEVLANVIERAAYDREILDRAPVLANNSRQSPRTQPLAQTPPRPPTPIHPKTPQPHPSPPPRPLGRVRAFAHRVGILFTHQPKPFWQQHYGDWCFDVLVSPRFKVVETDSTHSKSSLSLQQRLERIAAPSLEPDNFGLCIKLKDIPKVIDLVEVQYNDIDGDITIHIYMYGSKPEPDHTNELRDWFFVFDLFEYYDQLFRAYSMLLKPYSRTFGTSEKVIDWVTKILTGEAGYSEGAITPLIYSGVAKMFEGQEDGFSIRSWDLKACIKELRCP